MKSLICKYTTNTIDAKTTPLKVFMIDKSCELYCKYIKFITIKALTAKASNSSRYVYVKQTFYI